MGREEIRKRCREIQTRKKKAYRAYEKITVELGRLQRLCEHPDKRGGSGDGGDTCMDCGTFFADNSTDPLYADYLYQRRKLLRKFYRHTDRGLKNSV